MEKRSGFLTFLTALVPGVGYMYLGLMRKGIEALIAFLLITRILDIFTFGVLGDMVRIVIWCYAFIDTFSIAHRLDRGEKIEDTDFLIDRFGGSFSDNSNNNSTPVPSRNYSRNIALIVGWFCVLGGGMLLLNRLFMQLDIYQQFKSILQIYIIPVLLICGGVYLLFRHHNSKSNIL